MSSNKSIPFAFFKAHLADLLGNQSQHEYEDRSGEKKCAHVGEPAGSKKGIGIISKACQEETNTNGQKNLQRRIKGTDPDNDHEKTNAVFYNLDIAFSRFP